MHEIFYTLFLQKNGRKNESMICDKIILTKLAKDAEDGSQNGMPIRLYNFMQLFYVSAQVIDSCIQCNHKSIVRHILL